MRSTAQILLSTWPRYLLAPCFQGQRGYPFPLGSLRLVFGRAIRDHGTCGAEKVAPARPSVRAAALVPLMDMGILGTGSYDIAAAPDGILENRMLRIDCTTCLSTCTLSWARVGTSTNAASANELGLGLHRIHGQRNIENGRPRRAERKKKGPSPSSMVRYGASGKRSRRKALSVVFLPSPSPSLDSMTAVTLRTGLEHTC
ncbi:hypothetical protein OIDMADRAFT_25397 [Oidiodendron maius Zn]|uniref:Uncharacterized protein n=1 Tax=Oidiodendron maius (strain Zn) TaxID=913774 RepID=A0A0C3HP33_OIDMZ|nr:hypothetical protein OIDMADRAFT_25397 [Oidiodendron maius Zn]